MRVVYKIKWKNNITAVSAGLLTGLPHFVIGVS